MNQPQWTGTIVKEKRGCSGDEQGARTQWRRARSEDAAASSKERGRSDDDGVRDGSVFTGELRYVTMLSVMRACVRARAGDTAACVMSSLRVVCVYTVHASTHIHTYVRTHARYVRAGEGDRPTEIKSTSGRSLARACLGARAGRDQGPRICCCWQGEAQEDPRESHT